MSTSFDTLLRDVNIGNALYVGLLEGNGTELLKANIRLHTTLQFI